MTATSLAPTLTGAPASRSPQMYTQERLLAIALDSEAEYQEHLKSFGPGTYHEGRNKARERAELALACAAWLEAKGIIETICIGPFCDIKITQGQRVRVKAGSIVHTCGPKHTPEGTVSGRAVVMTVSSFDEGYVDLRRDHLPEVRPGRVTWAGAGGYWRWTSPDNVEII
jgi:hypothetical protein